MIVSKQNGQVVILMLLVMVIALAIGLSLVTRSNVEVSTSRKSEDSSRAFSAAEASLERSININTGTLGNDPSAVNAVSFDNQAGANVTAFGLPNGGVAMEYPPFGKEGFAQFWLASPVTLGTSYINTSFDLYFGNPIFYSTSADGDRPGIEVSVLTKDATGKYLSYQYFFDSISGAMGGIIPDGRSKGFYRCSSRCTDGNPPLPSSCPQTLTNNNLVDSTFYCKVSIPGSFPPYAGTPIMVRARILFSNTAQKVAVKPIGGGSLPKQFNLYTSTGISGNVSRTLEVFQQKSVMPQIFDFVLFSAQALEK